MIGGYSGGGLVAFEMAHQLTAAGAEVALVVLLDTFPPEIPEHTVTMRLRLQALRANDRVLYIRNIWERRQRDRRRSRQLEEIEAAVARGESVPSELRELDVEESFMRAADRYSLRPWRGRVVLMRAEKVHIAFQSLGDAYGWDRVVEGGFELLTVPGEHDTLVLEPNASVVVRKLRDVLDRSQVPAEP
jgi:thioesterase domain-containing protein